MEAQASMAGWVTGAYTMEASPGEAAAVETDMAAQRRMESKTGEWPRRLEAGERWSTEIVARRAGSAQASSGVGRVGCGRVRYALAATATASERDEASAACCYGCGVARCTPLSEQNLTRRYADSPLAWQTPTGSSASRVERQRRHVALRSSAAVTQ